MTCYYRLVALSKHYLKEGNLTGMSETQDIFYEVLQKGIEENASDWHIKENTPIALRIAGEMVQVDVTADGKFIKEIIAEMVNPAQMEKYLEIGDMDVSY